MSRPPDEADLDQLDGQIFATEAGRRWLDIYRPSRPEVVAQIEARLRRMRVRWGDKSRSQT